MLEIQKKLTNSFYAMLSLPSTAMGFALSIQISALSWILSTKYHLNIEEVGIVWAAGPAAGIIGQVLIGLISDKVWFWGGRRRPFILIGGVVAALMLIALPNIDKIAVFLGYKSLMGVAIVVALTLDLAINISFNPTRSIIADVTPEGVARTKGYTWMQTISGFFGVFAYVVGATLGNYNLIWVGVVIVLLFSVIPTFFIKESKSLTVETSSDNNSVDVDAKKTNIPELLKLFLAHGFSWIGIQTMFVFIFAYIQNILNIKDDKYIGQIIAISFAILNTVGFILPALVLEPITEKIGRVKTHMLCVATMALGYLLIVLAGNGMMNIFGGEIYFIYIFMAIAGIGWAAVVSLPFAIMTDFVNKKQTGLYMGIFNLSVVIPQLIVSLFIGKWISNVPNKNFIFIISTISLAISAALWTLVKDNKAKKSA
jgi:maltose/moltooligosaccharide transporter